MTEQPVANVKLTLEQLQQIDLVETRMANLQSELKNGYRDLNILTNDTQRITKEREYQQELLTGLSQQVKDAQAKVDALNTIHSETSTVLANLNAEISSKIADITTKEMALKDREDVNIAKEVELVERESKVSHKEADLLERTNALKVRITRISQVINE